MVVYISSALFILHLVTLVLVSMAVGGVVMYFSLKRILSKTINKEMLHESKTN